MKLERLLAIKDEGEVTRSLMQARCDRGAEIARMIGLTDGTAEAIRTLDEHWDGHGQPRWLLGEQIPLLGRILCLAQTVEIFHAAGGVDDAYAVARAARGHLVRPGPGQGARRLPPRRRLLGLARRARPHALGARGPADRRRRRAAAPDRHRVRGDRRRQVAVDVLPLGPHEPDRHQHGRGAGPRHGRARRPAAHRAAARHRQARGLQPDPRQALRAHGRRVRADQGAPAVHALGARAGELLRGARGDGGRPPRAARRQRLPERADRRRPDAADARAGGGRRVRGAHRRRARTAPRSTRTRRWRRSAATCRDGWTPTPTRRWRR